MTKNRLIYGTLVFFCLVFSMAYRSNFSAVLLIAVVLYLPAAAIFTAVSLLLADVRFISGNYVGEKNVRFNFELGIKNRFIMPFVPIELLCRIPDSERGVFEERRIFVTLQPFGYTTLVINGMHKYRGQYKTEIKKIYVVDPLGIVRFSRKINHEITMLFLPRRFALEKLFNNSEGEASVSRAVAKNAERDDFSHVRDYREGDILQLVHWKLTAKSDSIMIKEYENISDKNARILCDLGSCKGKHDVLLSVDTVIETALAFAKSLLNENIGSAVDLGDVLRKNIVTVKSTSDYERLYELMSMIPADAPVCDIGTMLSGTEEGKQSIVVLITAELNEQTVFWANSALKFGSVIIAYINLENAPIERDYLEEKFSLINIRAPGINALREATAIFQERA